MQTGTDYKVPYSRSFTEKNDHSRPGSTVDTRHVHVYLRRQSSRSSVFSSASAGLANNGDNVSLTSSSGPQSRPVSAESNWPNQPNQKHQSGQTNTRIILPNPMTINRFPTQRQSDHTVVANGATAANNKATVASTGLTVAENGNTVALIRSASIPLRRKPSYFDKLVWQVLDYLFMGGIEAAYNANVLCRLNIEYLIDISNVEPLKVPRNKRSDCPCLCSLETAHSRARMSIMIDEHSQLDLVPYFDDVNRFIESARSCGKNVLIHSYHGRNRCAALVAQYLMKTKNINLERAIELLKGIRPDILIGENFMRSLRKWEIILQQRQPTESGTLGYSSSGAVTGSNSLQNMNHQFDAGVAKKSAWM